MNWTAEYFFYFRRHVFYVKAKTYPSLSLAVRAFAMARGRNSSDC